MIILGGFGVQQAKVDVLQKIPTPVFVLSWTWEISIVNLLRILS